MSMSIQGSPSWFPLVGAPIPQATAGLAGSQSSATSSSGSPFTQLVAALEQSGSTTAATAFTTASGTLGSLSASPGTPSGSSVQGSPGEYTSSAATQGHHHGHHHGGGSSWLTDLLDGTDSSTSSANSVAGASATATVSNPAAFAAEAFQQTLGANSSTVASRLLGVG
jgi:hypothetical protein